MDACEYDSKANTAHTAVLWFGPSVEHFCGNEGGRTFIRPLLVIWHHGVSCCLRHRRMI